MEYPSKRIAEIAKEKGFDFSGLIYIDSKTKLPVSNSGERLKYFETEGKANIIKLPSYQELVEWIFQLKYLSDYDKEPLIKDAEWLEFWYNILIPELAQSKCTCGEPLYKENHNNNYYVCCEVCGVQYEPDSLHEENDFVLGGLTRLLINWFKKNGIRCYMEEEDYYVTVFNKRRIVKCCDTEQQARHEAIIKCFELMKGE
jgi:hypothetical protein